MTPEQKAQAAFIMALLLTACTKPECSDWWVNQQWDQKSKSQDAVE